jgi:hypothetical protein
MNMCKYFLLSPVLKQYYTNEGDLWQYKNFLVKN